MKPEEVAALRDQAWCHICKKITQHTTNMLAVLYDDEPFIGTFFVCAVCRMYIVKHMQRLIK